MQGVGRAWHVVARAGMMAALVGAGCTTAADTALRPPNVVVILVDDLRWDDLGIAGHPFAETPAIDGLAREGTRFLNPPGKNPGATAGYQHVPPGLAYHAG